MNKKAKKSAVKKAVKPVKVTVRQLAPPVYKEQMRIDSSGNVGIGGSIHFTTGHGKQLVRVVKNCEAEILLFDTIDDVNAYLFQFDQEHPNNDPTSSGTWIDLIVTGVSGDIFDLDQLEV